MPSPIADLTYRSYDGPLLPPVNRWWAIAKASIKLATKKRGFWVWSAFSGWWYVILIAIFYFMDNLNPGVGGAKNPLLQQIVWKDQFLSGFSFSQMLMFILALLLGVGTIANDNRANALLVYLSKPCSKADYVIGKWFGIFLPMFLVSLVPTMIFFLWGVMSYREYGFLTEDPLLFPKLIGMCMIPGVVHASLSLGISSLFNQGRLAGATYAGVYFMSLFFTNAMKVTSVVHQADQHPVPSIVNKLFYCSVDGIQIGLAKWILGTDGSPWLPVPKGTGGRGRNGLNLAQIPMPPPSFIVTIAVLLCVASLLVAWRRVRAVEVVG